MAEGGVAQVRVNHPWLAEAVASSNLSPPKNRRGVCCVFASCPAGGLYELRFTGLADYRMRDSFRREKR